MQIKQAIGLYTKLTTSQSPREDVELMLCHLLKEPRSYLFTWPEKILETEQQKKLLSMIARREQGEPVAYILGEQGFWKFMLSVSEHTLIPRPETEMLVEQALACCSKTKARVADLGTGTGAIALALAFERPQWQIVASDMSAEALVIAEQNRNRLKLNNITFLQGSWLEPHDDHYDLIISNPPYIDPQDPHLKQGDLRFEPRSALVSDNAGMADIQAILEQAMKYLAEKGHILLEHGYNQSGHCRNIMSKLGYADINTCSDYSGHERITYSRWQTTKG